MRVASLHRDYKTLHLSSSLRGLVDGPRAQVIREGPRLLPLYHEGRRLQPPLQRLLPTPHGVPYPPPSPADARGAAGVRHRGDMHVHGAEVAKMFFLRSGGAHEAEKTLNVHVANQRVLLDVPLGCLASIGFAPGK